MFIEKRSFKNSRSLTLAAIYEGEDKKAPTVVICHGYASSKDSVSQRDISKRLIKSGFSVYRFDFTGCGQSQGSIENLVPSVGLDDLNSAIADFGKKEFILCGTSFGGYVAILYASQHILLALALKCPVSDYPAVLEANQEEDKESRRKILAESQKIDIYQLASKIKVPTIIVHGDTDEIVSLSQSNKLIKTLGSKVKKLKIIEGGVHRLKAFGLLVFKRNCQKIFREK